LSTLRDTADTVERTAPMAAVSVFFTALCPEFSQDKAKSNRANENYLGCVAFNNIQNIKKHNLYINPKITYSF
jgi:hypothetical protein